LRKLYEMITASSQRYSRAFCRELNGDDLECGEVQNIAPQSTFAARWGLPSR
jgi:hypothetical protein